MKIKIGTLIFPILFICSSQIYSQESRPSKPSSTDSLVQEERSTESFRILNDAGTKFKNMMDTFSNLVVVEEISKAQDGCHSFLKDLSAIDDSLKNNRKLTTEDIRYIDRQLKNYRKIGESLLEDLRYHIKVDD